VEEDKDRLMSLCEQAAVEQNSQKLMALVAEITAVLDAKQKRLDAWKARSEAPASSTLRGSARLLSAAAFCVLSRCSDTSHHPSR
jgi:hypothetical protein